jgi:hypothetical protein
VGINKIVYVICNDVYKNIEINTLFFSKLVSEIEEVIFIDIGIDRNNTSHSTINYKGITYDVIRVKSIRSLYVLLSKKCIVISMFSEKITDWWVYLLIRYCNVPLIYVNNFGNFINFSFKIRKNISILSSITSVYKSVTGKLKRVIPDRLFYLLIVVNIFKSIDVLYISNASRSHAINIKYRNKHKETVLVNSSFYDTSIVDNFTITDEYIVFVDGMLPYHGDQINCGYSPIDKCIYFDRLNHIFSYLENKTNKEIVVCLHPNYDEKTCVEDYRGRKTIKNQTQSYIARASLVLFHDTTAIISAFVYNKKVIQLVGSIFNDFQKNLFSQYDKFKINKVDFMSDAELEKVIQDDKLSLNRSVIDEFIASNIISSGRRNETGCSQIINDLEFRYGLSRKCMNHNT